MGRLKKETTPYGNKEYVRRREALIPQAEEICDKAFKIKKKCDRCNAWTRMFMSTMDRLWLIQSLKDKSEFMTSELARITLEIKRLEVGGGAA